MKYYKLLSQANYSHSKLIASMDFGMWKGWQEPIPCHPLVPPLVTPGGSGKRNGVSYCSGSFRILLTV